MFAYTGKPGDEPSDTDQDPPADLFLGKVVYPELLVGVVIGPEHDSQAPPDVIPEDLHSCDAEKGSRPNIAAPGLADQLGRQGVEALFDPAADVCFIRDEARQVGLLDLHPGFVDLTQLRQLAEGAADQKGDLFSHEGRGVAVEEASVEELPPLPGKLPVYDSSGEHDYVGLLDGGVVEINVAVLSRVSAAVVEPAAQTSHTASFDVKIMQVVNLYLTIQAVYKSVDHGLETVLLRLCIGQNYNLLAPGRDSVFCRLQW